jgi:hypothetical protein
MGHSAAGAKDYRCVGLTNLLTLCADCLETSWKSHKTMSKKSNIVSFAENVARTVLRRK